MGNYFPMKNQWFPQDWWKLKPTLKYNKTNPDLLIHILNILKTKIKKLKFYKQVPFMM